MSLFKPRTRRVVTYNLPRRRKGVTAQAHKNVVKWVDNLNNLYGIAKELADLPHKKANIADQKRDWEKRLRFWEGKLAAGRTFRARQAARTKIEVVKAKMKLLDTDIDRISDSVELLVTEAQERVKAMHALDLQAKSSPDWRAIRDERKLISRPLKAGDLHGIISHVFAAADAGIKSKITGTSGAIGPKIEYK